MASRVLASAHSFLSGRPAGGVPRACVLFNALAVSGFLFGQGYQTLVKLEMSLYCCCQACYLAITPQTLVKQERSLYCCQARHVAFCMCMCSASACMCIYSSPLCGLSRVRLLPLLANGYSLCHIRLPPPSHTVTASATHGYRLHHIRSPPLSHTVTTSITSGYRLHHPRLLLLPRRSSSPHGSHCACSSPASTGPFASRVERAWGSAWWCYPLG